MNIYIDGTVDSGSPGTQTGTLDDSNTALGIGRNVLSPARYFNGTIDEVQIYNCSMNATEITNSNSTPGYIMTCPNGTSGLVGFWALNESGSTTTASDSSGQGNDGNLTNMNFWPYHNSSGGVLGTGAFEFDGIEDYVLWSDGPLNQNESNGFTSSVWIKASSSASTSADYIHERGYDNFNMRYRSPSNSLECGIRNSSSDYISTSTSQPVIQIGIWYHAACVYDPTIQNLSLYLNGILNQTVDASSFDYFEHGDTTNFSIGARITGINPFNGTIDEVAIYNRSLNASEIKKLYDIGLPNVSALTNVWKCTSLQTFDNVSCWTLGRLPKAYDDVIFNGTGTGDCNITNNTMPQYLNSFTVENDYGGTIYFNSLFAEGTWGAGREIPTGDSSLVLLMHMNNDSAYGENDTLVYDFSGDGNNGTVTDANWTSSGMVGAGAFEFDGNGDYISLPAGKFEYNNTFTVSVWINPNVLSGTQSIFGNERNLGAGYALTTSGNRFRFLYAWGPANWSGYSSTGTLTAGEWYHLVAVVNSTDNLTLYINGNFDSDSVVNIVTHSTTPKIGIHADGSEQPFNGTIDEVAIWNRTLSAAEIYELYAKGAGHRGTQGWNVTSDINISNGTMKIYGDYPYNITEEGHGQEWRSLSGDIYIGAGAILDGVGSGFPDHGGPCYFFWGSCHAGRGYYSSKIYGNASAPTSLGTGDYDYGGGSAIKLQSANLIQVDGNISMDGLGTGGGSNSQGSSGGSIWLKADNIIGSGAISAKSSARGGGGRIRLEYGSSMSYTGTISVAGGGYYPEQQGTLTFTNNVWPEDWNLTGNIGLLGGDFGEGEVINVLGDFNTNSYNISIYGDCFYDETNPLTCYNTTADGRGVWINASGNITISTGSVLLGEGIGFPGGVGPGYGSWFWSASHGGRGESGGGYDPRLTYGNETYPRSLGSGASTRGGGSAIKLESSDTLIVDGTINMKGASGGSTGASGGSIWFKADNISGTGILDTTGGSSGGGAEDRYGGSGGRIALAGDTIDFSGTMNNFAGTAALGDGSGGTVYINASTSITDSSTITTTGYDGGNITFIDTLLTLTGTYDASGTNNSAPIVVNYTDCNSSFTGAAFTPFPTYQTSCSSPGINTWNCTSLSTFDNASCWTLGRAPATADAVTFNGTGTGDCNITRSTMPQNLNSFKVEPNYTGTIYFNNLFANGTWGENVSEMEPDFEDDLVLLMHMNNNSAYGENNTHIYDFSGQGNNGTAVGFPWTSGVSGNALEFDGVDDYVEVADNESLNITNATTINAWVKLNAPIPGSSYYWIAGKYQSYELSLRNNRIYFFVATGNNYSYSDSLTWNLGQWYHIIGLTTNGTTEGVKLYRDGIDVNMTVGASGNISSNTNVLYIGRYGSGSDPHYMDGVIDEVQTYNCSMNATEIAAANNTPGYTMTCPGGSNGLVGHWALNESGSNTTAEDVSGYGNNGTLNNMNFYPFHNSSGGILGTGAFVFDGDGDYVDAGSDSSIDNIWNGGGTIMAWIYPTSNMIDPRIFSKGTEDVFSLIRDPSSGGLEFRPPSSGTVETNTSVPLNQWTHIAVTYDNSGTNAGIHFYFNGIEQPNTGVNPGVVSDASWNLVIGSDRGIRRFFNGTIDEVAIYNRTLSAAEIQALYEQSYHGTQKWNVTNDINISNGTMKIYGDYPYNITEEGHGQEWRSVKGNIYINSGAELEGVGLGFPDYVGPGETVNTGGTHGGRGGSSPKDPYGNATAPTSLGSGGGDGTGGGAAIKLHASNLVEINGTINMSGLERYTYDRTGSGGSIWLKADEISGSGILRAAGADTEREAGGGGRIRLEYGSVLDFTGMISLEGGIETDGGGRDGKSGTLTFTNNVWPGNWNLTGNIGLLGGDFGEGNVTNVLGYFNTNGYSVTIYGDCFGNSGNYKAFVCYNTTSDGRGVWINASGNITISAGSVLDGKALGFPPGVGPGAGNTGIGGAHGGKGGGNSKSTYGSETEPVSLGSGAENRGGAAIKLQTDIGNLMVDGTINMNGEFTGIYYRGGAGGSIWLKANNISGSGYLNATGGDTNDRSAGGAGRIALNADSINFNGQIMNRGGIGRDSGSYESGGGGTIYINATSSITDSGTITATGRDGGNITFAETLLNLTGIYNVSRFYEPEGSNGNIFLNYTDCYSTFWFIGTFLPGITYQTSCDYTNPSVTYTNPTPADEDYVPGHAYLNVSTSDAGNHTTFVDWNNSLVLWMRFNKEPGENDTWVRDWSSYGNNGTVYGNRTWNSSGGKFAGAFEFDGDGDYVDCGDDSSMDINDSFTISAWVYMKGDGVGTIHGIVDKYAGSAGSVLLLQGDGQDLWRVYARDASGTFKGVNSDVASTLNEWVHLVTTFNGTLYLFVNGIQQSGTSTYTSAVNDKPVTIGEYKAASHHFNGTIDEVMIFNRVLGPEEISSLYNTQANQYYHNFTDLGDELNYTFKTYSQDLAGNVQETETRLITSDITIPEIQFVPPTPANNSGRTDEFEINVSMTEKHLKNVTYVWNGTSYAVDSPVQLSEGLVLMMNFDNESSYGENETIVHDFSGKGNNGTAVGSPWTSGVSGNSLEFDGIDDNVDIGDSSTYCFSSNFSILGWARTTQSGGSQKGIVSKGAAGGTPGYGIIASGVSYWGFGIANNTNNEVAWSNSNLNDNVWYHFVGVFNGTNNILYIDGVLQDSVGNYSSTIPCTYDLVIGNAAYEQTARAFGGLIDEVMIFNRTLSVDEVNSTYQRGLASMPAKIRDIEAPSDNRVSFWNFDNDNSTEARDKWGINDGTVINANYTVIGGYVGGAFEFDGVGDYIDLGSGFQVVNYSVAFWVNLINTSNAWQLVMGCSGTSGNGYYGWVEDGTPDGGTSRICYTNSSGYTENELFVGNIKPVNGEWHHVVFTIEEYNATIATARQYTDGILDTELNYSEGLGATTIEKIAQGNGLDNPLNGTMDEVMIFNRSLNSSEIQALYNSYVNVSGSLAGYWALNESWSTRTASDSSGQGNDGNLTNFEFWPLVTSSGKYAGAREFDGDGDYIDTNTDFSWTVDDEFSAGFWINTNSNTTQQGVMGKQGSSGWEWQYNINWFTEEINFWYWNTSGDYTLNLHTGINSNEWTHIYVTYDGSVGKLYKNGVEVYNDTDIDGPFQDRTNNVTIGYSYWSTGNSLYFDGTIDEVRIWNRDLSADEISQLYYSNLRRYQDLNEYSLQYSKDNTTMLLKTDDPAITEWSLSINQSGLILGNSYFYSTSTFDLAGNLNSTETRTIKGNAEPGFVNITHSPSDLDDIDPNITITVTVNISDTDVNFDSAILQWKNATQAGWNNVTMNNLTAKGLYTLMNASFIPPTEDNYSYRIWANDTEGDFNTSPVINLSVFYDWTWTISSTFTEAGGTYNTVKDIGNFTINNTGDYSMTFSVTDDSPYGVFGLLFDGSNNADFTLNSNQSYKDYKILNVTATFGSTTREDNVTITTLASPGASADPPNRTHSFTLVSYGGGAYFYLTIPIYPTIVYHGDTAQNITARLRNLGNETAENSTLAWTLPTGWDITTGSQTLDIGDILADQIKWPSILVSIDRTSALPGTQTMTASASSDSNTSDIYSVNVVVSCTSGDDYCGYGCDDTTDADCAPAKIIKEERRVPSGGGAVIVGGLTEEQESRLFWTHELFELVRGEDNNFTITITNPLDDVMHNVTITIEGYLAGYLRLDKTSLGSLEPNQSVNITVFIEAPKYLSRGLNVLTVTIKGTTSYMDLTEKRTIDLLIHEISREAAEGYLNNTRQILDKMLGMGLNTHDVEELLAQSVLYLDEGNYFGIKENDEEAQDILDSALAALEGMEIIENNIGHAEYDGIAVPRTKRLVNLGKAAFNRGDFSLAKSRIDEAMLTFAAETKGEFNVVVFILHNWLQVIITIIVLTTISFIFYLRLKLFIINRELGLIGDEENVLMSLIKEIQRECFELGKMGMREYKEALIQYEKKLAASLARRVELESLKTHLLSFHRHKALQHERDTLVNILKETQETYLVKGEIETHVYENKMKSVKERLAVVDEELSTLEAEKEIKRRTTTRGKILNRIGLMRQV